MDRLARVKQSASALRATTRLILENKAGNVLPLSEEQLQEVAQYR